MINTVNIINVINFNASLPPTTKCSPDNIIPPAHVILLLSVGQAGGAWKPSNTAMKSKKCKGVRQQAELAQGVPGRLRPRIFLTFRHYKGGRSSAKRTGRLYPRRNPWYSLSEAESASWHMVLSGVPRKKSPVTPPGIDPGTVRLVAQRLNHYATPGPLKLSNTIPEVGEH